MNSKRLDKIKSARSLSDILDIVSEIAYEFKNSSAVVKKVVNSLSTEIVMDQRRAKPKTGVEDTAFVAPKLSELKKHVDVVQKLYDNVVELDAAEAMMKQSFTGNSKLPAALKAVKELKANIDASINDAFEALSEVAGKHLPKKMAVLVDGLTSHVIDVLPTKSYKNISRQVYVVPDQEDASMFHFCDYIGIEGLQNAQGFTYDRYYVIVTGVVSKAGVMKFHVNSLPDFKIPGRYPLGKEFTTLKEATKHVDLLLDHNNFVVDFEKQVLPLDDTRAKTSGLTTIKGIESVRIENDEITAILAPSVTTEKAAEAVRLDLQARLNSIVGLKKKDQLFQYKFVRRGSKRAVKFILTPNVGRKMTTSIEKLHEISEQMGLTDKQQAALRFALQH